LNKRKFWYITGIVAILYFTMGEISLHLLLGKNIINLGVFIPEGIALGFALYYGPKVLLGIFIGQLTLLLNNGLLLEASIYIALINSFEAYVAILLARFFHLNIRLTTVRDIIILTGMILIVLQVISAFAGNYVLYYFGFTKEDFLSDVFTWWFGNVMGQLLVTPFVLLLLQEYKNINIKKFFLYGFAFFVFEYFLELVLLINNSFLLLSLTLPMLVYVIFKEGLVYGLFFNIITALISSYSVYLGVGAFQASEPVDNIINYNLFILAHITISLTAGILLEEKRHYAEHLEDRVAVEVEKNRQQQLFMLQQSRLAQMGEMISMIAHQWRQPLNNLSMINQSFLNKYDKNSLDEKSVEYFRKNSQQQIALMSQTVDDFRNFFRSDKEKEFFYIENVITNMIEMTGAIFDSYHIKIIYECRYNAKVYGHANEFAQAILNIINNAKDVLLERDIEHKEITIIVTKETNHIVVLIEDNAGGIDEEIIDHIFDPYFSTKKAKNGTGLGLYMSKMIIEGMGANLRVFNGKNGAQFVITEEA